MTSELVHETKAPVPRRAAGVLRVSEIFESVQGEGPRAGTASVFLRLAGCNLRCRWCDTKYTWDWERFDYDREVRELPLEAVRERLLDGCGSEGRGSERRSRDPGCAPGGAAASAAGLPGRNLVVTGGEPLLQQRALAGLLPALGRRLHIEVETAGTLEPWEPLRAAVHTWNVSPKLAGSGNPESARRRPEVLRGFARMPNAFFKLVVDGEGDLEEALDLARELVLPRERVLLMPQAATRRELAERSPGVAAGARAHGLRFGPRLHVALWDGRRGV